MRKTVLITGSSRGIGRAIALSFLGKEYNVIVNYKKEEEKALEVVQILRENGLDAMAIKADVSDFNQVEEMFKTIKKRFRKVDILINNAGIARLNLAQDVSLEEWDEIFATNVNGMFNCTKLALPDMISNKDGIIVNTSSVWGQTGGSMESAYAATKGAIIAYTKSLAMELAPSNIRVNAVAPGGVLTDMTMVLSQETLDGFAQEVPMGRLAYPEEIADAVEFLVSDKSKYMTGQVLAINGGYYM